jgi:hypothetical protein
MAINMQGSWTVAVKSVEAFEPPQRFIIAGAATGNGTYSAAMATPPVLVTGDHWSISIQMDRGAGFVDIADQITFPTVTASRYHFDIQANFPDNDPDFDDVILTCSTPVTQEDFLIYGHVSGYSGNCIFNPCFLPILVIDTPIGLAAALRNPVLREPIAKLYPERLKPVPPIPPGPTPDPPPFTPLVIPLRDETAIPPKLGQVFKADAVTAERTVQVARTASKLQSIDFDRVAVSKLVDHLFRQCTTAPLPGVVLRFQEYDRTATELSGAPYTGLGDRDTLGVCATDRNGNYIFRFTMSLGDFINEALFDVAPGENAVVQSLPDVIVQLLDATKPAGFCYESAPYFNIPNLKRINICVPQSCIGRLPTACQGANAIQAIGNIFIGAPQLDGSRVGFNNFLGAEGRITARSAIADVPQARCDAWAGALDFFACFIDHPNVTQYTIRFRPAGVSNFSFFQELYLHPEIAKLGIPGYSGTKVGPFSRLLTVDGVPNTPAEAYDNIESNPAFVLTHRDRKAVISSGLYPAVHPTIYGQRQFGSVAFRIEGYDAAGHRVPGAVDTITLFIDNTGPDFDIDSVSMAAQTGGDCALFNLGGDPNLPLTVRFRANQLEGFLNSYSLGVRKGNIGGFAIDNNGPGLISGSYVHGDDLACNTFEGTFNDVVSDGDGYVSADIVAHNGRWLEVGQPFCTFAVQLSASTRVTNGYNSAVSSYGPVEYLLGIQAS